MSIAFILTSLVIVAIPGTGALFTMAAGLAGGTRAGIVAALGCTLGICPQLMLVASGTLAVLRTSSAGLVMLKLAGISYLLYMAWASLRSRGAFALDLGAKSRKMSGVLTSGALINVLNPKLMIFFFAFMPQFVNYRNPDAFSQLIELSILFMLLTLVVFSCYGKFASLLRQRVSQESQALNWLRRLTPGVFVVLAFSMALVHG